MNTTYKPIDPEFLHMLAGAKARGLSWTRLAELSKIPVGELEVIPWREPQEWAKASKYAEKLVAHEVLAEMVSSLRFQMNDPVNNGRLKSQVANSLVRVIQQQHALRTPKHPAKKAPPIPRPEPVPPPPVASANVPAPNTTPKNNFTPLGTIAALLFLVGLFVYKNGTPSPFAELPTTITIVGEPAVDAKSMIVEAHEWPTLFSDHEAPSMRRDTDFLQFSENLSGDSPYAYLLLGNDHLHGSVRGQFGAGGTSQLPSPSG